MKKKSLSKMVLNKSIISSINGGLAANQANYGNYSDVPSDLVSLPVAGNCPTDTFELSCICGGIADNTATPIDREPAAPVRGN